MVERCETGDFPLQEIGRNRIKRNVLGFPECTFRISVSEPLLVVWLLSNCFYGSRARKVRPPWAWTKIAGICCSVSFCRGAKTNSVSQWIPGTHPPRDRTAGT
jgi:hypothetical protein